ncbi:MAG: NUDIX domain-containing protein [Deltaproteobacteria bacterium]|nr:NUDIX domain-containing protein [Deltaproteobacteria bacterium]
MTTRPNTFCHFCGTRLPDGDYPRTCSGCGAQIWANPIPVAVALVPIDDGLLVIRRAIPPGVGKLALPGGFVEIDETWQQGCAREVLEETAIVIDPGTLVPFWFTSTEPNPTRVLLFAVAAAPRSVAAFASDAETSERGIIRGPDGLDEVFAFPLHAEAARRYFASRGITKGPHGFAPR